MFQPMPCLRLLSAMPSDLVIGLDSSTTATKAIAWNRLGEPVAEGRIGLEIDRPKPGWCEQQVQAWTGAASAALKNLATKIDMGRVAAIGISNQRESFAQFDAGNIPLGPGTLWLDERAKAEVAELAQLIGADLLHQISGKPADITPCIARCLWFLKHQPAVWARVAKTAEVQGVLTHFLTGHWHTSLAAADPMGLVDMEQFDWSSELLGAVGLQRRHMAQIFRCGISMGEVMPDIAATFGLSKHCKIVAGGGDGQCAGTGANVFVPGRAYLNLGTAVVSGSYGKAYACHNAFRTMNAVAEDGFIFETALRTGTFLVNWLVENVFNISVAQSPDILNVLEGEAEASCIGAHGLVLVPYWSGCITPYWDSGARGIIAGLSGAHTRGDIYRAMLEGICLEQVMTTAEVEKATSPITHYTVVGGGAKSQFWCQMIADASGRDVHRLDTVEASSLGAGMAAAKAVGWYSSIPEAAAAMTGKVSHIFRPRMNEHKKYSELLTLYKDLWPQMSQWNKRLQQFSEKYDD
jgi:sugar (pentulose or hexulose) kinase